MTINEVIKEITKGYYELILIETDKGRYTNSDSFTQSYHFINPLRLLYVDNLKNMVFTKTYDKMNSIEFRGYTCHAQDL